MEYVEKEDEFDIVVDSQDPEGKKRKAEEDQEMEEAIVSIDAIDTVSVRFLPLPTRDTQSGKIKKRVWPFARETT